MQLKNVAKLYKETNLTTMSSVDYTLLLLKECLQAIEKTIEDDDNIDAFSKAQNSLFELMSTANQDHLRGKRLFNFYIYMNQCLVTYRIEKDSSYLQQVKAYVIEMIEAWEATRPTKKRYSYKRHDLTT